MVIYIYIYIYTIYIYIYSIRASLLGAGHFEDNSTIFNQKVKIPLNHPWSTLSTD